MSFHQLLKDFAVGVYRENIGLFGNLRCRSCKRCEVVACCHDAVAVFLVAIEVTRVQEAGLDELRETSVDSTGINVMLLLCLLNILEVCLDGAWDSTQTPARRRYCEQNNKQQSEMITKHDRQYRLGTFGQAPFL